jgi:DNA-binding NtrC family response regulator
LCHHGTYFDGSELFGHEKGAFTNALERHLGGFEQADGGTLFLDEITEMAAEVQAKFLRALEEGQVRRIGATTSIPIAVRVVAATNRLPASAVKEGKLSRDLFYRLKVFHLALPPLRERGDDIPLLAHYYLESFGEKYQRPIMPWASDFEAALLAHSWPGNVRELRNAMERLALLAPGPNLTAADVGSVVSMPCLKITPAVIIKLRCGFSNPVRLISSAVGSSRDNYLLRPRVRVGVDSFQATGADVGMDFQRNHRDIIETWVWQIVTLFLVIFEKSSS